MQFNSTGTRLVTGSFDHTAAVWDAHTGRYFMASKQQYTILRSLIMLKLTSLSQFPTSLLSPLPLSQTAVLSDWPQGRGVQRCLQLRGWACCHGVHGQDLQDLGLKHRKACGYTEACVMCVRWGWDVWCVCGGDGIWDVCAVGMGYGMCVRWGWDVGCVCSGDGMWDVCAVGMCGVFTHV